jgi:hypothetical protein
MCSGECLYLTLKQILKSKHLMKKLFISLSIAALLFAGCSGNKTKESEEKSGTHTHDDGTVHEAHEKDSAKQEEFTAPADTASHSHDGHEHQH